MSDIPTKEEIDALERSIQKQWHDPTLQKFANAARVLHRIRESPGLTAEQLAELKAAAVFTPHGKSVAALLAAYDSQAAALAELERENHLFRHGLKEADAADCRRVVTTALEALAERDAEIERLREQVRSERESFRMRKDAIEEACRKEVKSQARGGG